MKLNLILLVIDDVHIPRACARGICVVVVEIRMTKRIVYTAHTGAM